MWTSRGIWRNRLRLNDQEIIHLTKVISMRSIFQLAQILAGLMAGPGVVALLPYLVSLHEYSALAETLVAAQFIILFSSFGLEIAAPRLGLPIFKAATALLITTTLFSATALTLFDIDAKKLLAAGTLAYLTCLSLTLQSYLLFSSRISQYATAGIIRALFTLACLLAALEVGITPYLSWAIGGCIGNLVAIAYSRSRHVQTLHNERSSDDLPSILRTAFLFFAINSSASLPFILDRTLTQSIIDPSEFSRYVLLTTWAMPTIYIGNAFQQYLIAKHRPKSRNDLLLSVVQTALASSTFPLLAGAILLTSIEVPFFESKEEFLTLFLTISLFYVFYGSIAFPAASAIQRTLKKEFVNRIAFSCLTIALLSLGSAKFFFAVSDLAFDLKTGMVLSFSIGVSQIIPRLYYVLSGLPR